MKHLFKTAVLTAIIAVCAISLPATAQTSRQNTKKQMAKAVISGSKGNVATVTTSNKPKTKSASEAKGKSPSKAKETPKAKTTTATNAKATTTTKAKETTTTAKAKATTKAAANSQQNTKTTSPKAQSQDDILIIKDRGIAGIRLGMKISKVPKSIPGLYNDYMEDYGCEFGVTYRCKVTVPGEYNYLEISDYDENGLIDDISVQIPGVRIDGTDIVIGTPISKIINTPGLKKKLVDKDDPENYELIYKGIYHVYPGRNDGDTEDVVCSIQWGLH